MNGFIQYVDDPKNPMISTQVYQNVNLLVQEIATLKFNSVNVYVKIYIKTLP